MPNPKHAANRQATFGEVLAIDEFRAVYAASIMSWAGDFLARAAVAALIFHTTRSVGLSATSFAISYLPGLTGGPVLAALAERYPHRTVMVTCDVARAVLIGAVALPGLGVTPILVLLFLTALLGAPFDASRSALLPRILGGDKYIVGGSLLSTTNGIAQVSGYAIGGIIAPFHPRYALAVDAITFVGSAACIWFGTRPRPAVLSPNRRRSLLRETAAGFRLVMTNPVLRGVAIVVIGASMFAIVPEGLAAAWASMIAHGGPSTGHDQALIMFAGQAGGVAGAIVVGLIHPDFRRRIIRPFAIAVPLCLVPALLRPSATGAAIMAAGAGFGIAGIIAPANGMFVQALPLAFRARAFGVMQFGLQFAQATAVITTGILADHSAIATVVGWWSIAGLAAMALAVITWPRPRVVDRTIDQVRADNAAHEAAAQAVSAIQTVPATAEPGIPATDAPAEAVTIPAQAAGPGRGAEPAAPEDEPAAEGTVPVTPAQPDARRTAGAKPSRPEPDRTEPGRAEPGRADNGHPDSAYPNNGRTDGGYAENAGTEAAQGPDARAERRPAPWPSNRTPRQPGRGVLPYTMVEPDAPA